LQTLEREERAPPQIGFRTRFPALDGIRALAVLMVFAFHYGGGAHGGKVLGLVNAIRLQGWAGVDIFFVLSGFLITGVLYDTRRDSQFFRRFYARRALRIFPVYYLVAALLLALTQIFHYAWQTTHLLLLVFLGNIPGDLNPALYQVRATSPAADIYLGHLWSLCVEEQFYLLWPLLVWTIRGRIKLLWTAAGLSLVALLLRVWLVFGSGFDLRGGWLLKMLPFHLDTLLIGAILALLLRGDLPKRWQRGSRWLFIAAIGALAIGFTLDPAGSGRWMPTIGFTLIAMAAAGLIGWATIPDSAVFRLFTMRPLMILGRYSYGFYVYHLLFAAGWAALTAILTRRLHSAMAASAIVLVVNFIVTFLVAKGSYDLVEVRFLKGKQRFAYDHVDAAPLIGRTIFPKTRNFKTRYQE
jgi:peptidoglycan/LPS O-acetylase OafA/YrhL